MPLCNPQGGVDIFKINGFVFSKWIHKRVAKKPGPQNPQNSGLPRTRGSFHSDVVDTRSRVARIYLIYLIYPYLNFYSNFFLSLFPG